MDEDESSKRKEDDWAINPLYRASHADGKRQSLYFFMRSRGRRESGQGPLHVR